MTRPLPAWVRAYRALFALLILLAIVVQFMNRTDAPGSIPANFFSFFTIQCNLFAAAVLFWGASSPQAQEGPRADLIRGAAVTYLSITGVVYGVLLSGYQEALQTTLPWVDTVLHKLMPLVMIFDWLVDPPRRPIPWRSALLWLSYPLLYFVYCLVRGPLVAWYPYPFLDPAQPGGYGAVAVYAIAIALGALLFVWLVRLVGRHVQLVIDPAGRPTIAPGL